MGQRLTRCSTSKGGAEQVEQVTRENLLHHHPLLRGGGGGAERQDGVWKVEQMEPHFCGPTCQLLRRIKPTAIHTRGRTMRPLNADTASPAPVTTEQRTQELWAEHASAIDRRDAQGAIDALMAIAELHGLLGDRVEVAVVPGLREDHSDANPR
jgi:hypothetical protein